MFTFEYVNVMYLSPPPQSPPPSPSIAKQVHSVFQPQYTFPKLIVHLVK